MKVVKTLIEHGTTPTGMGLVLARKIRDGMYFLRLISPCCGALLESLDGSVDSKTGRYGACSSCGVDYTYLSYELSAILSYKAKIGDNGELVHGETIIRTWLARALGFSPETFRMKITV